MFKKLLTVLLISTIHCSAEESKPSIVASQEFLRALDRQNASSEAQKKMPKEAEIALEKAFSTIWLIKGESWSTITEKGKGMILQYKPVVVDFTPSLTDADKLNGFDYIYYISCRAGAWRTSTDGKWSNWMNYTDQFEHFKQTFAQYKVSSKSGKINAEYIQDVTRMFLNNASKPTDDNIKD